MPMNNDGGRDITPVRNPSNGRFDFGWDDTGNPAFDDSDAHAVLSLLLEDEGGYWADATGTRGSTLRKIKLDVTGTDAQLAASAERALTPAVQRRQIRSVTTSAKRTKPGRYDLNVKYQNRDGHEQNTRLPIGG